MQESKDGLNRRDFLKTAAATLGNVAEARVETRKSAEKFGISPPPAPPKRLSPATRELASRGLGGEWGRGLVRPGFSLDERVDLAKLSEEMRYAQSVRLIAENAPLRIWAGQRIVGSASYREASEHLVPVWGQSSISHTTIGFDRVLKIGYRGLRKEIDERLARGGLDAKGVELLNAMLICLDAASLWHRRYAARLGELVASTSGEEEANYERVLANMRNVPENPPTCFAEAVQSLWCMWAFQRLVGNWSGIGRIDEMLGPYLKADTKSGRITLDEAREWIAHFWVAGTEWIGSNPAPGSGDAQFYQNIILGGVDSNGREITNDVTYLVLDVVEELHIGDFPIAVRISKRTPEHLLRRMAEVQRQGGGIVAAYNEDVVIDALVRFGYPVEEARCFANDGCWEALIPGKTSFCYIPFDTLGFLQDALASADAKLDIPDYADFESLYSAFEKRLRVQIDWHRSITKDHSTNGHPATTVSMMVEGCIEKGRGYNERGPKYTVAAPHAGGIANTANSLLAIKKLVYEEKMLTMKEYVEILRGNWQGQENLRKLVLTRVGVYGNDDDEADAMVSKIFDTYTRMVAEQKEINGVKVPAGISTFGREIEWRAQRKATADGHLVSEILATNLSPSPGTDKYGPTAVLKSYCKMDYAKLPNIGTLELKVMPSSVRGEDGIKAIVALNKAFVELCGCFLHIDVVDSALLLDAQRNPDKYPNLAVRIAGWSARFDTLNKDWQDMIIGRTQQVS